MRTTRRPHDLMMRSQATLVATLDMMSIQYVDAHLRNDKLLLMEAAPNNGLALQFAHESLKDDFHLAFAAITNQPLSFQVASERMRSTLEVATAPVGGH